MAKTKVVLFDSNETLLDLSALDPLFGKVFGDPSFRQVWFKQVLELALAATVIGRFKSFDNLADAALDMVAEQHGREPVSERDRAEIREAVLTLPAFPDVRPALERLREAGLRLAVLTNSSSKSIKSQMNAAGLKDLFEEVLSVDAIGRFKPARETYEYAAEELDVAPREIRLVAAHAWDVAGALAAGCKAAFVQRPGKALDPSGRPPGIIESDLHAVADRILEKRR